MYKLSLLNFHQLDLMQLLFSFDQDVRVKKTLIQILAFQRSYSFVPDFLS